MYPHIHITHIGPIIHIIHIKLKGFGKYLESIWKGFGGEEGPVNIVTVVYR